LTSDSRINNDDELHDVNNAAQAFSSLSHPMPLHQSRCSDQI